MGIIRKTMSVSSAGLIDYRSDKERIARSTKKTHKAVKEQTKEAKKAAERAAAQQAAIAAQQQALAQEQNAIAMQQAQLAAAQLQVTTTPPGWYQDPTNPMINRWWDGSRFTEHVQSRPRPRPLP